MTELGRLEQCEFCFNGQEAVVRASELILAGKTVSHVLTDFMMPRLNGVQTVRMIRNFVTQRN